MFPIFGKRRGFLVYFLCRKIDHAHGKQLKKSPKTASCLNFMQRYFVAGFNPHAD
jgi:hypothetical protein